MGFLVFAALILSGCMIRFEEIEPIPASKDFAPLSCEQLAGEKHRIELGLNGLIKKHSFGTKESVGTLKGEADAVNAELHRKACTIAPVLVPHNRPLYRATPSPPTN